MAPVEFSEKLTKRTFDTMQGVYRIISRDHFLSRNGEQQPRTAELDAYRRADDKDCAKRKRLDFSRLFADEEEDMQVEDDHHGEENKEDANLPTAGLNGRVDNEDGLISCHFEQQGGPQTMEGSIQHIRQKMGVFTNEVSSLLDAGKSFFVDAATAFEERIVQLHRNQMEKWEQDIELLRAMDSINEDMSFRLADARATISFVRPALSQIQASS